MAKWREDKVFLTVLIAVVAISALPLMSAMNQSCTSYLDGWTKKSVATIVVASGISAALSVIEDTELGVGLSIALGDAVRPLNDMVGRVVSVAVASAVSLGIQRVLVDASASAGLKWVLMLSMLLWLVAVWTDSSGLRRFTNWLLVVALVFTFAIPGAIFLTGYVGDQFTKGTYAKAQNEFKNLETEVKQISPRSLSRVGDQLKSTAAAYSEFAVDYIVVFILQTMLMPLLFLWGLIKLLGFVLSPAARAGMEARFLAAIRASEKSEGGRPRVSEVVAEGQEQGS